METVELRCGRWHCVCVCAHVHAQGWMDRDWRGVVLKERKGLFMGQLILPKR